MTNEEKILATLETIQSDIKQLKYDVATLKDKKEHDEFNKLTPEERKAQVMAALEAIWKTNEEDPEGLEAFLAIMDAEEKRKAARWEESREAAAC